MNNNKINAVFFDCWDTLISFECNEKRWNILSLHQHCVNKDRIDWEEVFDFSENFFNSYYTSRLLFEIDISSILSLFVKNFDIELDCPIETCTHEILKYLDPKPIDGISEFLDMLDEKGIYYAVISNTIYPTSDTLELINKLVPGHHFGFFLGSNVVGVKKPNPLFFKTGVTMGKQDIAHSMYIGDVFYQDVIGSYNSGFHTSVWLNHKKKEKRFHDQIDLDGKIEYIEVDSYRTLISKIKEKNLI